MSNPPLCRRTADALTLVHAVPRSRLQAVLAEGLHAESDFPDLGLEMRQGVVYCWLRPEDDRLTPKRRRQYLYLQVQVEPERCTVADMDIGSLAMMYLVGSGGRPRHPEASRMLAEVYRMTSMPLIEYREGMFATPEVLVKGHVGPECLWVPG